MQSPLCRCLVPTVSQLDVTCKPSRNNADATVSTAGARARVDSYLAINKHRVAVAVWQSGSLAAGSIAVCNDITTI